MAVALILVKVAAPGLCPRPGSEVLGKEVTAPPSEDHQARLGGRRCPLSTECWGTGPSVLHQDVADWWGWNLCTRSRGAVGEGESIAKTTDITPSEKKIPPKPPILLFLTQLHYNRMGPPSYMQCVID